MSSPLEQFEIKKLIDLTLFGYDVSITNSAICMFVVLISSLLLFWAMTFSRTLLPSKLQACGEMLVGFVNNIVEVNIGKEGRVFAPFIFTFFWFILVSNLLGLLPYSFTITSQIVVTFTLAIILFVVINIYGLIKNGWHFFSLFLPKGTPLWLAPLMVVIELFAYLTRPISLALRLFANMVAGHILLKILAGFAVSLGILFKILPIAFVSCIVGLEFFISLLQAYIFTILACVYLNDAINLH